ncbi:MAG: zinc-ribbon domain-containing protein [Dehalococcoidia bacterium]
MHQRLTCPGCGTQIAEDQQFCGICGTKLSGVVQSKETVCTGCGSPIAAGQSFCGVCGTKLPESESKQAEAQTATDVSSAKRETSPVDIQAAPLITQVPPAAAKESAIMDETAQSTTIPPSTVSEPPPLYENQPVEPGLYYAGRGDQIMNRAEPSHRKYTILRIAAVIFQIFGWIVLVGGVVASIAMAVFAGIGGTFETMIGGQALIGWAAIGAAIGGVIVSLIYGFGLLAFAGICNAIVDIARSR